MSELQFGSLIPRLVTTKLLQAIIQEVMNIICATVTHFGLRLIVKGPLHALGCIFGCIIGVSVTDAFD